jgi:glutathione synthase/RimK-type ligase-like ATP-grasp enzyme
VATPVAPILFPWSEVFVDVAFVTCAKLPEMTADDRLAADVLREKGIAVVSAVWDDPAVDWRRFGCVVIRSAWDYHHQQEGYAAWLRRCAADRVNLWNPPPAVLNNMNKRYLSDLTRRGVDVVPTEYLELDHGQNLRGLLERRGWDQAVVKPAVSASAYRTWRTSLATAERDQPAFDEDSHLHEVLVQPHVEEIVTRGEWSLVFFGGQYSHGVIKQPAAGDFRVQGELGGTAASAQAPDHLIDAARHILSFSPSPLLYARVDGVERERRFMLMELEINEPYLFIGLDADAAVRFAEAIEAVL